MSCIYLVLMEVSEFIYLVLMEVSELYLHCSDGG